MKKSVLISPILSFGVVLAMPAFTFAQRIRTGYIDSIIDKLVYWLNLSVTLIMVVMTLWFLISVFRYIAEKDAGKLAEKRKVMLNGLLGLFIAVSVWGIIRIAQNVFDVGGVNPVQLVCPPGTMPIGSRCIPG